MHKLLLRIPVREIAISFTLLLPIFAYATGGTWTQQTNSGSRAWAAFASSADGTKLAATDDGPGYIYTSTDSGATWTQQTNSGSRTWQGIASSADGTKLAATDYNGGSGYIYTSTDSGATWTQQTGSGLHAWYAITSSSDGTKLAAVDSPGYIYTSTDSGATWTQQTGSGSRPWLGITSSSDGTKLAAVSGDILHGLFGGAAGNVYTSTDSGATWTQQTNAGTRYWFGIASSANGTKLAAAAYGDYVYTSTDSGATWTQQTGSGTHGWFAITSSSDGTKLAAADGSPGYIYTSADGGVSWTQQTNAGSRSWFSITSSSNGAKLAAGDSTPGYIYTNADCGGVGANCGVVSQGRIIRLVGHIRLRGGVRLAGTSAAYKTSCLAILNAGSSKGDGIYTIRPAGSTANMNVYCDMTNDGGGWTLLLSAFDPKGVANIKATPTSPNSDTSAGFLTPEDLGFSNGTGKIRLNCKDSTETPYYAILSYAWNMSTDGWVNMSSLSLSTNMGYSGNLPYSQLSRAHSDTRCINGGPSNDGWSTYCGRYQPANDVVECNNSSPSAAAPQTMWYRES